MYLKVFDIRFVVFNSPDREVVVGHHYLDWSMGGNDGLLAL